MRIRTPLFIVLPLIALALLGFAYATGAAPAQAQQPSSDSLDIDLDGCSGFTLRWIDGRDDSTRITIAIGTPPAITTISLDDVTGDQGGLFSFEADPGDLVRARLFDGEEELDEVTATIPACPTATATPTSTSTSVPTATNTPAPTSTPPAPVPTPIVIVTERIVEVPVVKTIIQPPSTGDAGLAD